MSSFLRSQGLAWTLIVLGALGGLVFETALARDQRSTALLEVSPAITGTPLVGAAARAAEEVELVGASGVLDAAMTALGWSDPEAFRERLDVKWITDTSLISVSFRHPDAELASRAASAVAQSFVERRRSLEAENARGPVEELTAQIESLEAETTALASDVRRRRAELATPPGPGATLAPVTPLARQQLETLELLLLSKQQALSELRVRRDDIPPSALARAARIVQPARAAPVVETSRQLQAAAVGALAGFIVLLGRLGFRRAVDGRLRRHREAALALGVPLLGALRPLPPGRGAALFVRDDPASAEADDVRALSLNLTALAGAPLQSVLATSAAPRRGGAVLAANLAFASAERGIPTVLIDADLHHPSAHQTFGMDPRYGLVDLLADPSAARSLARFRVADHLFVIPRGGGAGRPNRPLRTEAFSEVLGELRRAVGGLIIVVGAPIVGSADALTLATCVQGVLVVADPTRSSPDHTRRAIQLAQQVRATVIGVVLDGVHRSSLDPLARPPAPERRRDARRGKDRTETLARRLLLLWAALLGVQFHLLSGLNIAASDFVLAALLLIVVSDRRMRRRAFSLPGKLRWFFVTMALALVSGSLVTAFSFGFLPTDAWLNKGLGLGVLAAAVGCVRAIAHTRDSVYAVLRALVLGAIVSTTIALVLWLEVLPLGGILPPPEVRFTGFLTNPNAAALYYTVGLLLLFGTFAGAPLGLGRWTRIGGLVVLGLANVLTVSLSALVSGIMAFAVLVMGLPRGRAPAGLALLVVLLLALPSLGAALAPASAGGDVFEQATASRSLDAEPSLFDGPLAALERFDVSHAIAAKGSSTFDRLAIDVIAIELWSASLENLVFGVGLGAFAMYAAQSQLELNVIIHNTYLWLVTEMGLLGLIALAILLWYVAELSRGALRQLPRSTAVPLVATFVLFLVWWQFNEGLYQRVFWLLLGAASVLTEVARASNPVRSARPAPGVVPSPERVAT